MQKAICTGLVLKYGVCDCREIGFHASAFILTTGTEKRIGKHKYLLFLLSKVAILNLFKNEKDENRKKYKTWLVMIFLILLIGGLLAAGLDLIIFGEEGDQPFEIIIGVFYKVGLIYVTIWYGLKSGMKKVWAWILGFSTLLPVMWLISIAYLLTRKTPVTTNS